jgi:3-deoxy-7-phosphoheptulonate synthase
MVVVMKMGATPEDVERVAARVREAGGDAFVVHGKFRDIVGLVGDTERFLSMPLATLPGVDHVVRIGKPYKLVARELHPAPSTVAVGPAEVGRGTFSLIAGPCAVETRDQAMEAALGAKRAGATLLRGGAYKPRTSPYSFQGLAQRGLEILAECREVTGLPIVTEVMEARDVDHVAEVADALQIGTRNMQNFSLLKEVGRTDRPVVLKRGLWATVEEWLMAAEYIAQQGNSEIILCERGIRTFETSTRNTLDLAGMAVAQQESHLPVIVDPSHATGERSLVGPMARAALAAGADGVMIEIHPRPSEALCDGPQALTPDALAGLVAELATLGRALGRPMAEPVGELGRAPAASG